MTKRTIDYISIDEVKPADSNPKKHDPDISTSMQRLGYTEPIVLDERTGQLIAGHGRIDALKELRDKGAKPPEGVSKAWEIPVVRGWASKDDDDVKAALIASNRLPEKGGWDMDALFEMLGSLDEVAGTGYSWEDLDELFSAAEEPEVIPVQQFYGKYANEDDEALSTHDSEPSLTTPGAVPGMKMREVVFLLAPEEHSAFIENVKQLSKRWGITSLAGVVTKSVKESL